MKIKTGLAILFLFACGFGIFSEAAAVDDETGRPSYYYGPAPYEQDMEAGSGEQWYPDYMPAEFGENPQPEEQKIPEPVRQPEPEPKQEPVAPLEVRVEEGPVSADFVPYDKAQERYSAQNDAPPEQEFPQQAPAAAGTASADAAPEIDIQDADGFIPYDYAREKYSN